MNSPIEPLQRAELFQGLKPAALELLLAIRRGRDHKAGQLPISSRGFGRAPVPDPGRQGPHQSKRGGHGRGGTGDIWVPAKCSVKWPYSMSRRVRRTQLSTSPAGFLSIPKDAFDDLLFSRKELAYEVLWGFVRCSAPGCAKPTTN